MPLQGCSNPLMLQTCIKNRLIRRGGAAGCVARHTDSTTARASVWGIHAAKMANRFEALEPIRQGVCEHFGAFEKNIAERLSLRHDHGSQYVSDDFQNEIAFLGVQTSPSFVREPQGNGCAERFIRTLKENLLWVKHFSTVEELRIALLEFRDTYNQQWLIQRHDYKTPEQARDNHLAATRKAA